MWVVSGNSDYIDINVVNDDILEAAGTFSIWANMDDYASDEYETLIVTIRDGTNRIYIEYYTDNTMRFYHIAGGTFKHVDIDVSAYSGWHLFSMTWNIAADEMKAYIDGSQVGVTQTGLGVMAGAFIQSSIGSHYWSGAQIEFFNGQIDEVKIYNRTLSGTDISALYNSGNQYKSDGNWTSANQTMPSGHDLRETKIYYSNVDANNNISRIEWIVDGVVKANYTNISSGTTRTITNSNLTWGSFYNVTSDYKIKLYLNGTGSATPTVSKIEMFSYGNNSIYHNNFIGNTNQSYDEIMNTWYSTDLSEGNYWSNHTSPDSNGDGIVDNPLYIDGGSNADNYPFTDKNGWIA